MPYGSLFQMLFPFVVETLNILVIHFSIIC